MRLLPVLALAALASCTPETADVTFTVQVPPTDEALINRAEAQLADSGAEDVELIGTVTGRDEIVLVAEYMDSGEDCVVVFEANGSSSGCGGLVPSDQWIVLNGSTSSRGAASYIGRNRPIRTPN